MMAFASSNVRTVEIVVYWTVVTQRAKVREQDGTLETLCVFGGVDKAYRNFQYVAIVPSARSHKISGD